MAFALKLFLRLFGLAWAVSVAALAWKYAPELTPTAAPSPKPVASSALARSEAPTTDAPRVVYQGLVTGTVSASRPIAAPGQARALEGRAGEEPRAREAQSVSIASAAPIEPAATASARAADAIEPAMLPIGARRVDLNTASVAELNGLGVGMIGRAVVGGRPYASPEDLLGKRVLNRATYARIRNQVAVR